MIIKGSEMGMGSSFVIAQSLSKLNVSSQPSRSISDHCLLISAVKLLIRKPAEQFHQKKQRAFENSQTAKGHCPCSMSKAEISGV